MQRGSKSIKCTMRPQIENIKYNIRYSARPFDGCGYPFKTAISELRKEGLVIIYVAEKCQYIKG